MNVRTFCCIALVVVAGLAAPHRGLSQNADAPTAQPPAAEGDSNVVKKPKSLASYYIGLAIAEQMQSQNLTLEDIDVESFGMALTDQLSGGKLRLSDEELQQAGAAVQALMRAKAEAMQQKMATLSAANKEKAELFMAENGKAEGVKTLASGVQYKVLRAGNGASPKITDTVRVHYTGKLLNGQVFDSSVERGQPAEFPINNLIPGWQQALPMMKVGDKWLLYIPPQYAYREQGSPPVIGPNELLIFEMELLDIVK